MSFTPAAADHMRQAVIWLPNGYYVPADPAEALWDIDIVRFILLGTFGALLWEYIITFHEEVVRWKQLFQGKPTLVGMLVIAVRYCILVHYLCMIAFYFNQLRSASCSSIISMILTFVTLAYVASSAIMIIRLRSLWSGDEPRWLVPLVTTCLFWIIGVRVITLTGLRGKNAAPGQSVAHYPICTAERPPHWRNFGWMGAAVFDVLVYGLTLYRTRQLKRQLAGNAVSLDRLRQFVRDSSTVYFVLGCSTDLAVGFTFVLLRHAIFRAIPLIFSAFVETVVVCRIVFHSDLFTDDKTGLLILDWRHGVDKEDPKPRSRQPIAVGAEHPYVHPISGPEHIAMVTHKGSAPSSDSNVPGDAMEKINLPSSWGESYVPHTLDYAPSFQRPESTLEGDGAATTPAASGKAAYAEQRYKVDTSKQQAHEDDSRLFSGAGMTHGRRGQQPAVPRITQETTIGVDDIDHM